ncbi:hypothetical protein T492DRAFT_947048 [Pavlovales sp. CCMP2436]|nr:hypothetical protein T492DRAFT_947048 [Pavlovales sp. CCMP2436]|mmetsp:Transcript_17007/g.43564  ORF Transcript_17007/g.43564 Transcript_17007/m.43564 type:complete len:239 (-) Transcript_17007:157-873(-)
MANLHGRFEEMGEEEAKGEGMPQNAPAAAVEEAKEEAAAAAGPAADGEEAEDDEGEGEGEPAFDLLKAQDAKALGNARFAAGEWQLALDAYTEALMWAPSDAEERAVYFCNRAACFLKMEQWETAEGDCTAALEVQPRYVKALSRRLQACEAQEKLSNALADAKMLAEIEQSAQARATVTRLEKKEAEKLEREKEEMMGKLKDLGNMFLGNFGMSMNNFKAVQDEGTGSYNISYDPNA